MAEVDVEALRQHPLDGVDATDFAYWSEQQDAILTALEQASTAYQRGMEDQVVADNHSWEAGERELEAMTAERDLWMERAERADQTIREVKAENERLRLSLGRWNEHLPGCAKWRHVTERVGSLNVCNGEDVLDDEQECTCGYEGRWNG